MEEGLGWCTRDLLELSIPAVSYESAIAPAVLGSAMKWLFKNRQ